MSIVVIIVSTIGGSIALFLIIVLLLQLGKRTGWRGFKSRGVRLHSEPIRLRVVDMISSNAPEVKAADEAQCLSERRNSAIARARQHKRGARATCSHPAFPMVLPPTASTQLDPVTDAIHRSRISGNSIVRPLLLPKPLAALPKEATYRSLDKEAGGVTSSPRNSGAATLPLSELRASQYRSAEDEVNDKKNRMLISQRLARIRAQTRHHQTPSRGSLDNMINRQKAWLTRATVYGVNAHTTGFDG